MIILVDMSGTWEVDLVILMKGFTGDLWAGHLVAIKEVHLVIFPSSLYPCSVELYRYHES